MAKKTYRLTDAEKTLIDLLRSDERIIPILMETHEFHYYQELKNLETVKKFDNQGILNGHCLTAENLENHLKTKIETHQFFFSAISYIQSEKE